LTAYEPIFEGSKAPAQPANVMASDAISSK